MSTREKPSSKPSSTGYGTELAPAPALRLGVLVAGWLALLAGFVMILHLELSILVKVTLSAIWSADLGRTLGRQARAMSRVRRLTVAADGAWLAHVQCGKVEEIQILADSVVTERVAWLRLRLGDGRVYGELLTRTSVGDEAWRRLRLIWRWGVPPNDK